VNPSANRDLDDTSSLLQSRQQGRQRPTAAPGAGRPEAEVGDRMKIAFGVAGRS
jgi:hypothetical protein